MKKHLAILILMLSTIIVKSQTATVNSPDNKLSLTFFIEEGKPLYSVKYNSNVILENSPLGLITNDNDFSQELKLISSNSDTINKTYEQTRIKKQHIEYIANKLTIKLSNTKGRNFEIVFQVSNNDIAFCYKLPFFDETASAIIKKELSGFQFPQQTTTFLTPQATPQIGWKQSKPSYEETYEADEAMGTPSKYGLGYTFPGLFHVGDNGWVLVSETGVDSHYCGSRLSEANDGLYTIEFPHPDENKSIGSSTPIVSLPAQTPWRTLTVSNNLKPIVETTIPFDVVTPLYEPSQDYEYGRSTWSWIMWQDHSMNYEDQVTYIDLAADMGYEYILIDALWDTQVGYDRIPDLINYAHSKGVDVFIWYNSNGYSNNAPQGPKHKMDNSIVRKKEMKWLQSLGVKGLKVDFFGGDKQETMKLYEDILSDANEYGLMIIFHGSTLPRGWERMYPNYVGSEAVLASENLIFTQVANDNEAFNASLHPFIRNAVGSMEFGPVLLNKRHNRTNDGGTTRRTSDIFQLATSVLFQNPVQMFALAPNNLTDVPEFEIEFMKQVPTTWDETVFIDGYPGEYCILARRHDKKWYVVGVNAQKEALNLKIKLPMLSGKMVTKYYDDKNMLPYKSDTKVSKDGEVKITIQPNGGIILKE